MGGRTWPVEQREKLFQELDQLLGQGYLLISLGAGCVQMSNVGFGISTLRKSTIWDCSAENQ